MKRIHLLPNVVTAFGLTCGLFVIFKTNMLDVDRSSYETLQMSVLILLLAGFADILDGAIARATGGSSEFGVQFDSLADAISFGVAPSVLMLKSLALEPQSELSFFATSGAMVFSVCGVLRLVRFNMTSYLPDPSDESIEMRNFTGLPVPGAAAAAVSANLFLQSDQFQRLFTISESVEACILTAIMFVLGYFMVSRWKFPSLKSLQFRVPSFQLVFATVISAVLIFFGMFYYFALMCTILSWGYVLLAWGLSITRLVAGRRTKTLEDFEPEPDEME